MWGITNWYQGNHGQLNLSCDQVGDNNVHALRDDHTITSVVI
jgi:hypothetical protein